MVGSANSFAQDWTWSCGGRSTVLSVCMDFSRDAQERVIFAWHLWRSNPTLGSHVKCYPAKLCSSVFLLQWFSEHVDFAWCFRLLCNIWPDEFPWPVLVFAGLPAGSNHRCPSRHILVDRAAGQLQDVQDARAEFHHPSTKPAAGDHLARVFWTYPAKKHQIFDEPSIGFPATGLRPEWLLFFSCLLGPLHFISASMFVTQVNCVGKIPGPKVFFHNVCVSRIAWSSWSCSFWKLSVDREVRVLLMSLHILFLLILWAQVEEKDDKEAKEDCGSS